MYLIYVFSFFSGVLATNFCFQDGWGRLLWNLYLSVRAKNMVREVDKVSARKRNPFPYHSVHVKFMF